MDTKESDAIYNFGTRDTKTGLLCEEEHKQLLDAMKSEMGEDQYRKVAAIWMSSMQLAFKCQGCGNCCAVCDPVVLSGEDIDNIARGLKIPRMKAIRKYVTILPSGRAALKHVKPCKFYDFRKKRCKIYEYRPHVCRYYPFLAGQDDFTICTDCPGSVELFEILKQIAENAKPSQKQEEFRQLCLKDPELSNAAQILIGTRNAMELGEITKEEAERILFSYPYHDKLNLVAVYLAEFFGEKA
jgi:Fe-S-cluster containining protein